VTFAQPARPSSRLPAGGAISLASITKLDPNYVAEIFRRGPPEDIPLEEPDGG
jgi:hypothetical protein